MAAAQAESRGDEWGLAWYLQWRTYTSIPTWTHSQNSPAAAEALSVKKFPMEHLSNDHKDGPNQHKNSHELCRERSSPFWVWQKLKENWDNMIRIFKWRESYCRTHTSIKRGKEILKSRTVRVTLTNQGKKVTLLSKDIWDGKIIRVHLVYQFYQNRLASSYHGCQSIQSQKH